MILRNDEMKSKAGRRKPTRQMNPYRQQALESGWTPNQDRGRTGYDTLNDTFRAMNRNMSLGDFQTQKYGSSPQELRQVARQDTRPLDRAGAYEGRGAQAGRDAGAPSLAGVTDFDTWAGVQRDPRYQANQDKFLATSPEQLARSSAPAIDPMNLRGSLEQAGLWNAAPEQPSGGLFDASGNLLQQPSAAGGFQPPVNIERPQGGYRPPPSGGSVGVNTGAYGDYDPTGSYGGGGGGKRPGWVGNVGGPQDGRPVMGNFAAGRRRRARTSGQPQFRRWMQNQLGGR